MNKKLTKISILSLVFLLTGCSYISLDIKGDPITSDSSEPETSEPESSEEEKSVVDIEIYDNKTYNIGDTYDDLLDQLTVRVKYSDGSIANTLPEGAHIHKYPIVDENGNEVDTSKPFDHPMVCSSKWYVTHEGFPYGPTLEEGNNISFIVQSGFEHETAKLTGFEILDKTLIRKNNIYHNIVNYELRLFWDILGTEIYHFDSSSLVDEHFSLSLIKAGGTSDDVSNQNLIANETYVASLTITKDGNSLTKTLPSFKVYDGSYQLNSPKFTASDVDMSLLDNQISMKYTRSLGELNILVVPVSLYVQPGDTTTQLDTFNSTTVDKINSYFFDTTDDSIYSLKEYYEQSSYGKLKINGCVAPLYEETQIPTSIAAMPVEIPQLKNQKIPVGLYQIFTGALNKAFESLDIDWSKYDMDKDNKFDTIHFITNYHGAGWGTPFWPQYGYKLDNVPVIRQYFEQQFGQFYSFRTENNSLKGSIYAMHTLESLTDPNIAIHEQGHVFGLQDYYDYTNNGNSFIDYVGGADMQSQNFFDYNAFSKFSLGWANPIVVDGSLDSTTITFKDFATSGEFILIPANESTYNKTAFDEYFLLELFTKAGNNAPYWDKWEDENNVSLGNGGIRLYHVDARLVGCNSSEFLTQTNNVWYEVDTLDELPTGATHALDNHVMGANNSYNYTAYPGYPFEGYSNYKLLSLIQAGGNNTFGTNNASGKTLTVDDLYQTGDIFNFDSAKQFLLKDGSIATSMDNGETFPYIIYFEDVNTSNATIRIEKI